MANCKNSEEKGFTCRGWIPALCRRRQQLGLGEWAAGWCEEIRASEARGRCGRGEDGACEEVTECK